VKELFIRAFNQYNMFIFHFVLADCNETDREDFKCELELLLGLKHHDNVVKLLGHCKSKDVQMFLYE